VLFLAGSKNVSYDGVTSQGNAALQARQAQRGINRKGATAMQNYNFNVSGKERKQLVMAISEILGVDAIYKKPPTYAFEIGNIMVDRNGCASGDISAELLTALAGLGFVPEVDAEEEPTVPKMENTEEFAEYEEQPTEIPADTELPTDSISIDVPLDGFSPEAIDRLCKLVLAKSSLIKMAIGAEELPIQVLPDRISFDWFKISDSENMMEYDKFINALCETAKRKQRVTARANGDFENPRFSMRTWLTALGMAGSEYSQIRRIAKTWKCQHSAILRISSLSLKSCCNFITPQRGRGHSTYCADNLFVGAYCTTL